MTPQLDEGRHRSAAQALALRFDPPVLGNGAPTQAALDEVDRATLQPGERRTEKGEEVATAAAEPLVPQDGEERAAERRVAQPPRVLDGDRHPQLRERRVEWRPPPVDGLADDGDALRRVPPRRSAATSLARSSTVPLVPAASRNRIDPSSGRPAVTSSENSARSRWTRAGGSVGLDAGGSSSMCGPCERREVLERPRERRERCSPGLVRDGQRHVRAPGECLHERPFGAREILEAVSEEGRSAPCVQIAAQAFDGIPTHAVAIAHAHPPQLLAIRADERRELAAQPVQLDEPGLELADRLQ